MKSIVHLTFYPTIGLLFTLLAEICPSKELSKSGDRTWLH